jgi:hypothetical protein
VTVFGGWICWFCGVCKIEGITVALNLESRYVGEWTMNIQVKGDEMKRKTRFLDFRCHCCESFLERGCCLCPRQT